MILIYHTFLFDVYTPIQRRSIIIITDFSLANSETGPYLPTGTARANNEQFLMTRMRTNLISRIRTKENQLPFEQLAKVTSESGASFLIRKYGLVGEYRTATSSRMYNWTYLM